MIMTTYLFIAAEITIMVALIVSIVRWNEKH